jgi:regulator of sigma E protease
LSNAISWTLAVLAIPAAFLILIAPHEAGHFLLAKLCGMRVHEYSIGLGTRLWERTIAGTRTVIRLLPVGGYVRIAGMEPGEFDRLDGFHRKPARQRISVLVAGPLANFLIAMIAAAAVFLTQVNQDAGKVGTVTIPSAAYDAGIRPGDRIVSVDGRAIRSPQDIRSQVDAHTGETLALVVVKEDGRRETLHVTPRFDATEKRSIIGVGTYPIFTPGQAVLAGALFPVTASIGIVAGIYQLSTGQIQGGILGPEGATGAIGISYLTIQAARAGWITYLWLIAVLSVALGLANLLPLPALDGGRIVVVLLEKLRGRPFNREREMQVQRYGLAALLAVVAFIAYFDVQRIVNGEFQFPGIR